MYVCMYVYIYVKSVCMFFTFTHFWPYLGYKPLTLLEVGSKKYNF